MKFAKIFAIVLMILSASNAFAQPYDIKALAKKGMTLKADPKNNIYKAASEVQAGTVIDFAVSLPPYSVIQGVQIYAKNGVGMTVNRPSGNCAICRQSLTDAIPQMPAMQMVDSSLVQPTMG